MNRPPRSRYIVVLAGTLVLFACSPEQVVTPGTPSPLAPGARTAALSPTDGELVMQKLANPRGLAWGPEGAL